jgi:hypothetical protein
MSGTVSILRYHTRGMDLAASSARMSEAVALAGVGGGLLGIGMFQSVADESEMMGIAHFETDEAAVAAWDGMVRSGLLLRMQETMLDVPNWQRFQVRHRNGTSLAHLPADAYASLSIRTAHPGHGRELVDDIGDVLTTLESLPGYLGGVGGTLVDLEDAVMGLAFWADEGSFRQSLPAKTMYRIDLYRRRL